MNGSDYIAPQPHLRRQRGGTRSTCRRDARSSWDCPPRSRFLIRKSHCDRPSGQIGSKITKEIDPAGGREAARIGRRCGCRHAGMPVLQRESRSQRLPPLRGSGLLDVRQSPPRACRVRSVVVVRAAAISRYKDRRAGASAEGGEEDARRAETETVDYHATDTVRIEQTRIHANRSSSASAVTNDARPTASSSTHHDRGSG